MTKKRQKQYDALYQRVHDIMLGATRYAHKREHAGREGYSQMTAHELIRFMGIIYLTWLTECYNTPTLFDRPFIEDFTNVEDATDRLFRYGIRAEPAPRDKHGNADKKWERPEGSWL